MRAMSASGRAADSDLPPEQRRSAAGEAAMETGIALLPAGIGRLTRGLTRGARPVAPSPGYTPEEIAAIETFVGGAPDARPTDLAPPPATIDIGVPPVDPRQAEYSLETERMIDDILRGQEPIAFGTDYDPDVFYRYEATRGALNRGEYDDVLSEEDLRRNFRELIREDITGMLSPDAMRAQGVPEEEIARIRARYEDLETRFPDIVQEEMSFLDDLPDDDPDLMDLFPDDGAFMPPERATASLPPAAPAAQFAPANPYDVSRSNEVQSPLSWRNEGIAGLYSRSAKASQDLRQPAYGDINQLRKELEARGAPPKELDLQMDALQDLFAQSNSGKVPASAVQEALGSAPGLQITRTSSYADYGPSGGTGYTSTYYTHPSVKDGPGAALKHFGSGGPDTSPPLFHTRAAQYTITPDGSPANTHHVLEIQSDWAQHRQTLLPSSSPEAFEALQREARNLMREGRIEEAEALVNRPTRAEFDAQFPAPLIKNENDWVDAGVRQNLIDAVNAGSDWITFGNGRQANQTVYMPLDAAKRFYDKQVPSSVERVLRKLSREAETEFPELQDVPFVDGDTVKGLRITPELREAILKTGLPSFRDGGLIQTPAGTRRGTVLPATFPEGMSGGEALMSGQAELALPGMIVDPINSIAEALMTVDRLRRGENLPKDQVESAGMTLAAAPMSPAALARPRPNTLFANPPSGGRKVQARFSDASTLSKKATENIRAPEAGSMTGATKRQTEDLASRKAAPGTGEGRRAEIADMSTLRLVRTPVETARTKTQGAAPQSGQSARYDPVTGEATASYQRKPGDVYRMAAEAVSGDPSNEWLEVPAGTLERLNMTVNNFTDPKSRVSPDKRTVYLASGPDTARFLQAWGSQAEFFGLPKAPTLTKPSVLPNRSIFGFPTVAKQGKSFEDLKQEARSATVKSQGPAPKSKFFD
jgi:hypothetical protein